MKKVIVILLSTLCISFGYTQSIDRNGKNINGFNRIRTGDGEWMDIQLLGSGSSFRVRDNITNKYFVKWDAGKSFTDFTQNVVISNGNLGIGTTSTPHKLTVEGSIGAKKISVRKNGWSDFVFYDNYKLRKLEEVESYIAKNKHLPEVPSEAEVCEKGIDLGDMDATLLQKIEELTLYLIEQNKEIKALKEEVASLKKK